MPASSNFKVKRAVDSTNKSIVNYCLPDKVQEVKEEEEEQEHADCVFAITYLSFSVPKIDAKYSAITLHL